MKHIVLLVTVSVFCSGSFAHDSCTPIETADLNADPISSATAALDELPTITESQVLSPPITDPSSEFGDKLDIDGNTLVSASENRNDERRGTVNVYESIDGVWQHIKTLRSPNQLANESFAFPSVSGDNLVVGATKYCPSNPYSGCANGTAYFFERNEGGANNWGFVNQVDGGLREQAYFGHAPSIDGNTAAVMASDRLWSIGLDGAVYIFERDIDGTGDWVQVKRIESDHSLHIGQDGFGDGLFVRGDTLLVKGHDSHGFVFNEYNRNEGGESNWGLVRTITREQTSVTSSDFDGTTLLIRVENNCIPSDERTHSLLFYGKNDQAAWTLQQEIAVDFDPGRIRIDGRQALVFSGDSKGGFLLERGVSPDSWKITKRLISSDENVPESTFQHASSLSSGRSCMGWPWENSREGLVLCHDLRSTINAGMNDAWVHAGAANQGIFLTAFPELEMMFAAWFTFDSERPDPAASATIGAPDQRWITALGPYSGSTATLAAELTTGGRFNSNEGDPLQDTDYGTIEINFSSCAAANVSYNFPSAGHSSSFDINRVLDDNVHICEGIIEGSIDPNTAESKSSPSATQVDGFKLESKLLAINAGMNDAWVNPEAGYQGMFTTVFPDHEFMFAAWFVFDDQEPQPGITAQLGAPDQRWLTAFGNYSGTSANLTIENTTGGVFERDDPVPEQDTEYGTMQIDFADCNNAAVSIEIPSASKSQTFVMERAVANNSRLCELLGSQ